MVRTSEFRIVQQQRYIATMIPYLIFTSYFNGSPYNAVVAYFIRRNFMIWTRRRDASLHFTRAKPMALVFRFSRVACISLFFSEIRKYSQSMVQERRTKRFPPRFRPVRRFCELRFRCLSPPIGREGEISPPLDHIYFFFEKKKTLFTNKSALSATQCYTNI